MWLIALERRRKNQCPRMRSGVGRAAAKASGFAMHAAVGARCRRMMMHWGRGGGSRSTRYTFV